MGKRKSSGILEILIILQRTAALLPSVFHCQRNQFNKQANTGAFGIWYIGMPMPIFPKKSCLQMRKLAPGAFLHVTPADAKTVHLRRQTIVGS